MRLILGDCLEEMKRLPDGSVDFIFTDPPYGHKNNDGDLIANWEKALGRSGGGEARPIMNDGVEANDLFRACLPQWKRLLKSNSCCCCCCCGGGPDPQFARWSLWMDEVLSFKQMVIWDKGPIGMGWHYRRSYETVLVAQKGKGKCAWYDRSMKVENIIRPASGIRKIIPSKDQHPTPKPVELAAHFIRLHTRPGDLVLDPFMGGGSTAEACLRTGRRFIGIELDPRFYEMARLRIDEALTEMVFETPPVVVSELPQVA